MDRDAIALARDVFRENGLDPADHAFATEDAFDDPRALQEGGAPLRPRRLRSAGLRQVAEGGGGGARRLRVAEPRRAGRPRARRTARHRELQRARLRRAVLRRGEGGGLQGPRGPPGGRRDAPAAGPPRLAAVPRGALPEVPSSCAGSPDGAYRGRTGARTRRASQAEPAGHEGARSGRGRRRAGSRRRSPTPRSATRVGSGVGAPRLEVAAIDREERPPRRRRQARAHRRVGSGRAPASSGGEGASDGRDPVVRRVGDHRRPDGPAAPGEPAVDARRARRATGRGSGPGAAARTPRRCRRSRGRAGGGRGRPRRGGPGRRSPRRRGRSGRRRRRTRPAPTAEPLEEPREVVALDQRLGAPARGPRRRARCRGTTPRSRRGAPAPRRRRRGAEPEPRTGLEVGPGRRDDRGTRNTKSSVQSSPASGPADLREQPGREQEGEDEGGRRRRSSPHRAAPGWWRRAPRGRDDTSCGVSARPLYHRRAMNFANRTVVLGVGGRHRRVQGRRAGARVVKGRGTVRVAMTPAATRFVGPLTFQAVSGAPVLTDLFDASVEQTYGHLGLARAADLFVVAPATADLIARLRAGHGRRRGHHHRPGGDLPGPARPGDEHAHVEERGRAGEPRARCAARGWHGGRAGLGLARRRRLRRGTHGGAGGDRARDGAPARERRSRGPQGPRHRRADARANRSGPLHLEPFVREDGLRARGGRRAARRRGRRWSRGRSPSPSRPASA